MYPRRLLILVFIDIGRKGEFSPRCLIFDRLGVDCLETDFGYACDSSGAIY
jgi:hypothetical protein